MNDSHLGLLKLRLDRSGDTNVVCLIVCLTVNYNKGDLMSPTLVGAVAGCPGEEK